MSIGSMVVMVVVVGEGGGICQVGVWKGHVPEEVKTHRSYGGVNNIVIISKVNLGPVCHSGCF